MIPREVLDDSSSSSDDDNNEDSSDKGQDQMDEGSPLESGDSFDSDQQLLISGSGGLYMEYVGGSNQLVPIVDETSLDMLDRKVLSIVAWLVESRVLPPPFVQCECCGV